ncbi:MAG: hypothetical protein ACRENE_19225 [Polyangiaceae bacterium]
MAGAAVLAVATGAVGSACSSSSTTQEAALEVVVSTDVRFPQDYDAVEVKVFQQGTDGSFSLTPALDKTLIGQSLPQSVAIVPGHAPNQVARIVARALKGLNVVLEKTAQVQVPASGVEELDMFLGSDCFDVSCSALLQQTCVAGTCKSWVVDPSSLTPYNMADLSPTTPDATLSFVEAGRGDADASSATDASSPTDAHSSGPDADAQTGPDAPKEAAPSSCGAPGASCCPFHQCNAGCCVYGTCVGQGSACTGLGAPGTPPVCTNGVCANCGAPNMACCPGMQGTTCTAPFTVCQTQTTCEACGMNGLACCPGNVCTPGLACMTASDGGKTCSQCGGQGETCCDVDSGVQGWPMSPCMPGTGLTCLGNQCL